MRDCYKCIYPLLDGCPCRWSYHCAACINLFKDRSTCTAEKCETCRLFKYCKEKGINLNKEIQNDT